MSQGAEQDGPGCLVLCEVHTCKSCCGPHLGGSHFSADWQLEMDAIQYFFIAEAVARIAKNRNREPIAFLIESEVEDC